MSLVYWCFTTDHNFISTLHHHQEEWNVFSFPLLYLPLTGSLSVKADSTVSNILPNEQSSGGSEGVPGIPWGSVKFRYTVWTSRAVLSSRSSPRPRPPSSSAPLRWEALRWAFPLQASVAPCPCFRLLIPLTQPHLPIIFTALHTPPTLQRRCTRL